VVLQEPAAGELSVETIRAWDALNDKIWSFADILDRYIRIDTYSWTTMQAVGTQLAVLSVPANLILANCSNFIPFTMFKYWRGNVHLRFQLNGTRFHNGRLNAFFCPQMSATDISTWHGVNKAAQTTVLHSFMDPSASSVIELVVPFTYLLNYLAIQNDEVVEGPYADVGTVSLRVFNALQAVAGSSTSLEITLSVRFVNTELKIPIDNHAPSFLAKQVRFIEAQGNTISNKAYNVIQRAGSVTIPTEVTGDKFDIKSKVSGMDKVNIGTQPMYVVRKPLGYINHSNNIEMLQKLSLDPSALNLCDFQHFGVERDEMALSYLLTLPTYSDQLFFTWSDSAVTGTVLQSFNLGPLGKIPDPISVSSSNYSWFPTLWEYTCIPYTYWRGDIILKLDIVATAFHTGKLWVAVNYGASNTVPSSALAYHKYGVALDLNAENHHYEIRIPFLSNTEWKRVYNGPGGFNAHLDAFIGMVQITVMNPLVHPNNVSSMVDVNCFLSGGSNFEVSCLAMNNSSWRLATAQGSVDMANVTSVNIGERNLLTVGNLAGPVVFNDKHFGEKYKSIRDVMKRYGMAFACPVYSRKLYTVNYNAVGPVPLLPHYWAVEASFSVGQLLSNSHLSWWSSIYRVWRGSMRAKILPHTKSFYDTTYSITGPPAYNTLRPTPIPDMKYWVYFDPNMRGRVVNVGESYSSATTTRIAQEEDRVQMSQYCVFPTANLGPPDTGALTSVSMSAQQAGGTVNNYLPLARGPLFPPNAGNSGNAPTSWRAPPGEIFDLRAMYAEIEIPFQTMYSTLFCCAAADDYTAVEGSFGNQIGNKFYSPGMIYISRFIEPTSLSAPEGFNLVSTYNIMAAIGDDFRLGMLLGPHRLIFCGIAQTDVSTGVTTYEPQTWDDYALV
jgi:hypothetical protein